MALSREASYTGRGDCGKYRFVSFGVFYIWLTSTETLVVGCLMTRQHACVCQGQICTDNFTCCQTEIEVADQTFYLT